MISREAKSVLFQVLEVVINKSCIFRFYQSNTTGLPEMNEEYKWAAIEWAGILPEPLEMQNIITVTEPHLGKGKTLRRNYFSKATKGLKKLYLYQPSEAADSRMNGASQNRGFDSMQMTAQFSV